MPTILFIAGFRFFFYSNEGHEPPHIHVEKGDAVAKFWLSTLEMEYNEGFKVNELKAISVILDEHKALLIEKWYEYFNR